MTLGTHASATAYPDPMLGETEPLDAAPLDSPNQRGGGHSPVRAGAGYSLLTRRDKAVMALMVGIPTFLCIALIWLPTLASIVLSFTNWRGITPLDRRRTSSASRTT